MKFYKYSTGDFVMRHKTIDKSPFAFLCNVRNREKLFRKALSKLRKLPEQERSDWTGKILTLLKVRPKLKEGFKMFLKRLVNNFVSHNKISC